MLELEEVMNASQIVATGSQFWKHVMQEVHNKIVTEQLRKQVEMLVNNRDEKRSCLSKKSPCPD